VIFRGVFDDRENPTETPKTRYFSKKAAPATEGVLAAARPHFSGPAV